MTSIDLTGRRALVTGAAGALGGVFATALAEAGAAVMLADVNVEPGREAAEIIAKSGATAAFTRLDVTQDDSWAEAVAATVDQLGGFDILVNNAGLEVTSLMVDLDVAELSRMIDVNVIGTMLGIKHAFRAMRPGGSAGDGGSVVNIASVAATIAFPGIAGYSATKSAVDRITRVSAMEAGKLGYGVRVNCICPGLIANPMGVKLAVDCTEIGLFESPDAAVGAVIEQTPLGRLGTESEMADAVVFLSSDAARFVTGAQLSVDGGMGM